MDALAVVLETPKELSLKHVGVSEPQDGDVVVDIAYSAISTGTERLLWSGRMPPFPGMGYPLVPGYEAVGEVVEAPPNSELRAGDHVFVPGARCFTDVHGLFGGAASRLVTQSARVAKIDSTLGERGALLALAATAYHAMSGSRGFKPELIVGHGVLGRLIARLAALMGGPPSVVWERDAARAIGAEGYVVINPAEDERRDYASIYDASGAADLLDELVARVKPRGEIVLAGFYEDRLSFDFPPAFMKEARIRVAAEWTPEDLVAVRRLVDQGHLSLDGLITHRAPAHDAARAYETAFEDADCLKMVLDWSQA